MHCFVQPKWHPLHSYALALQIPLMDKLLDTGVDINLVDKVGSWFILCDACPKTSSSRKVVLMLGVLLIQDGFTPLHKAIIGKKEAVISHLLRKGANPHVRDRVTGTIFSLI